MRFDPSRAAALALLIALTAAPAFAGEVSRTFDFQLGHWQPLEEQEEPITLHRIRLDAIEGRITKSSVARPHNQEYLETLRVQLEYTNTADRKWKARISARWLDENGRVIDGIGANETLDRQSARKIAQFSLSTLKYGVERAKTLQVTIHYEP